jgi:hypothetical protein
VSDEDGKSVSVIDRASLWRIAFSARYETGNPVLLIVEHAPPVAMRFRVYQFAVDHRRCAELPIYDENAA